MKTLPILLLAVLPSVASEPSKPAVDTNDIRHAEKVIGLEFNDKKRELMLEGVRGHLKDFEAVRTVPLPNSVPPALLFNPLPAGFEFSKERSKFDWEAPEVELPADREALAFYSVAQLSGLIRARKITSEELTVFCLERLKKYGPKLECIITLTEDLALEQARQADREIAEGKYRGPLHGIPYGAKDLLATRGIKTTWGAAPFKEQIVDEDATVITRLRDAGAVLVAKLTLGAIAWGDVWYGGTTKNPWNLEQGSSGSSAGSAAATSAGLVPFAIGSETWGSIISPSSRCGVTGLRPTYGRVSRAGAMALSWSMDKLGPMARSSEDCALVFSAIHGPDPRDQTLYDAPFVYQPRKDLRGLKIGYLESAQKNTSDQKTLDQLRELGAELVKIELPKYPIRNLSYILGVEAAAAFDELTRDGRDDQMVRQVRYAWPNAWRESRLVPAVEYIQANRVRHLLIQEMAELMTQVDLYVAPPGDDQNSLLTNLTGHPCVVLPNGFDEKNRPQAITFIGRLFDEGTLLATAQCYQEATPFHLKHPRLD